MKARQLCLFAATITVASSLIICPLGCRKQATSKSDVDESQTANVDTERAEKIWDQTVAKYQDAKTYQDDAVLNLRYRLSGKWIEEYHPQGVAFDRNQGLSAKVFHARIAADQDRMTCFVYDSSTGNLDDQVWLSLFSTADTPNMVESFNRSWHNLVADPIARHFISGESEVPIDADTKSPLPELIPVPLDLLLAESKISNWARPLRCSLSKEKHETQFVIFVELKNRKHKVWIDKESWLIQRIQYDPRVLNSVLQSSDQVTDLLLETRFENAKFDPSIDKQIFSTSLAGRAKPVKHFVKIPEAFPSKLIGQPLPEFDLHADGKAQFSSSLLAGLTTAMIFIQADYFESKALSAYLEMAEEMRTATTRIGMVISGEPQLARQVARQCEKDSRHVSVYLDPHFQTMKKLEILQTPTILIMDLQNRVQYFKVIGREPWLEEVKTAIRRVAAGENLAAEMRREYEQFLEKYHHNLTIADPFKDSQPHANKKVTPVSNKK